ncbi:type I-E CRISPR-associated protein Cse2/CasB [Streptomyces sp. NBC_00876]|uniref:type I-E CRISPR-associated protein Cse2/CasB n=1 Tax=Streptomyces sp. NBC_00876 TaxID=2975853 RepID=UPI0038700328|nr:type I-E CRISPR-associated protein Cse2/CasB [Streptomyces sp. NBC_00876]
MTTTTAPPTPRLRVERLAGERISAFQRGYLAGEPSAVAALARLRRGAGQDAGSLPDLWSLVDISPLHEPCEGARDLTERELVRAEDALHTALTLWALHQQSRREAGMHQRNSRGKPRGVGAAVRRMMNMLKPGEIDEPLRKRLVRVGTAPDLPTLAQRLRDIVLLLRREQFPLDYALLAGQLYEWQRPGGPDGMRREWGRSFHAWHEKEQSGEVPNAEG